MVNPFKPKGLGAKLHSPSPKSTAAESLEIGMQGRLENRSPGRLEVDLIDSAHNSTSPEGVALLTNLDLFKQMSISCCVFC